jgi:N-acetylmuramic acid 6-phosphate etherase
MSSHEATRPTPPDRGGLSTEKRNPRTLDLHTRSVGDLVTIINREDRDVPLALKRAGARLTRLIEAMEPGFLAGGRIVYVGAGTSGRLGVLDASEAPPTFHVPPTRVVGIIAGGDSALRRSSEGAEDDPTGSHQALADLALTAHDAVIAIAAGATTPYALGALAYAKAMRPEGSRPLTCLLTCARLDEPPPHADHVVTLNTGPEVIAGSTRMKAGTATKLALNTISTTLMIRAGRVHENLMVDLRATNAKLRDRAARIVSTLTGLPRDAALDLVDRCEGETKTAIVAHHRGVSPADARTLLDAANGRLDAVIA